MPQTKTEAPFLYHTLVRVTNTRNHIHHVHLVYHETLQDPIFGKICLSYLYKLLLEAFKSNVTIMVFETLEVGVFDLFLL